MNDLDRVTHIMDNCKILDTIVLKGKKEGSLSIISSLVEYEGNKILMSHYTNKILHSVRAVPDKYQTAIEVWCDMIRIPKEEEIESISLQGSIVAVNFYNFPAEEEKPHPISPQTLLEKLYNIG